MDKSQRIHILGTGNIGRLYAHALSTSPKPPPITLLFHRPSLINEFKSAAGISINNIQTFLPNIPKTSTGYDYSLPSSLKQQSIRNLIVATKTYNTLDAVSSITSYLHPNATILFTQNGAGTTEEVLEFMQNLGPSYSPGFMANCLESITTHGIYSNGPFSSVLAGYGNITIGRKYQPLGSTDGRSSYLLEKILQAPLLNAHAVSIQDLALAKFKKLVVNCMINPLSVVFRRKNGDLFKHPPIFKLMITLFQELLPFIPKDIKNEIPVGEMVKLVLSVAETTAGNTSSMLQDFEAGRQTEIDYLNGWFVNESKKIPEGPGMLRCNKILIRMVKAGELLKEDQIDTRFETGKWWGEVKEDDAFLF